ncbi:MAG: NAD(P)/FAD-dependent oxidoreductase [Firmicutes bacterium]|nr:NAD(P)/FAD-dependent oxidoreductase [Bacillota bacterium]
MGRAAIVGAGPAGLACAIWAHRVGWESVVVEREAEPGGQLRTYSLPVVDLPGFGPAPAAALIDQLVGQVRALGIPIHWNTWAEWWDGAQLVCRGGMAIEADWLFYAPGLRPRRLHIVGEELAYAGSVSELAQAPPLEVLVVGGGDRAVEGALRLAQAGHAVTLVARSSGLKAQRSYQDALNASRVKVLRETRVLALERSQRRLIARLESASGAGCWRGDEVVVRIGMEPDSGPEWLTVSENGVRAARPRMTVVGDAAHQPWERSLVTAFASAMRAVKLCALSER